MTFYDIIDRAYSILGPSKLSVVLIKSDTAIHNRINPCTPGDKFFADFKKKLRDLPVCPRCDWSDICVAESHGTNPTSFREIEKKYHDFQSWINSSTSSYRDASLELSHAEFLGRFGPKLDTLKGQYADHVAEMLKDKFWDSVHEHVVTSFALEVARLQADLADRGLSAAERMLDQVLETAKQDYADSQTFLVKLNYYQVTSLEMTIFETARVAIDLYVLPSWYVKFLRKPRVKSYSYAEPQPVVDDAVDVDGLTTDDVEAICKLYDKYGEYKTLEDARKAIEQL